ncbi:universal stress protein [Nonomuraea sp. SBT364]|uniref:universal stress protein n=1 Tax=Nonomuraea sp. SBT364 TaxID=1580530 RepID=UPI00066ED081|nr:universal stress protein [Nonomuraea sp. SBT364]
MIVVGVDGSRAGLEAAEWAAGEALLRGVPLLLAHAMTRWAVETGEGRLAEVAAWMREGGRSVLQAARERAGRDLPEAAVRTTLLAGDPREALISAGRDAELLVLGSHGIGGVRGMLVGSVAHGVAGRAPCDVVLVRELPSSPRQEIVAGVDDSEASARVLDFAFAEARLRGCRLRVVHAWNRPGPFDDGERPVLREVLAGPRERHPGVPVIEEAVRAHPVEALRQAATGAELLVAGSRGRGTLAGMVLGSVSQALLQHAPCPLVVVRAP